MEKLPFSCLTAESLPDLMARDMADFARPVSFAASPRVNIMGCQSFCFMFWATVAVFCALVKPFRVGLVSCGGVWLLCQLRTLLKIHFAGRWMGGKPPGVG